MGLLDFKHLLAVYFVKQKANCNLLGLYILIDACSFQDLIQTTSTWLNARALVPLQNWENLILDYFTHVHWSGILF